MALVATLVVPVVATAPPAAALDCRAIDGTFRDSDLCQAVNTPASDDWGVFWRIRRAITKNTFATCELAMEWLGVDGNGGITNWSASFPKYKTAKVTDTTVNVSVRMVPKATIRMTRPRWQNMTAYQTAALDELMRRLEVHEMGHVQVIAEVSRLQTGTELVDTTVTTVRDWFDRYRQDSGALQNSTDQDYDDVTTHGRTQGELGGLNTTVQICDPVAAILGDVPGGTVNVAYSTVLRLDKANPDDDDIVITDPVAWAVTQGALPPGINLAGGTLSGTPTQAGQFSFTVQATDANGLTADRAITLTVQGAAKAVLREQEYGASGSISVTNTGFAQACHGAGFGLTSDEVAGTGTELEYDLTSTTDRFACHAPSPTAVDATGVPAAFAHAVSVSATAGVCTKSGSAELDAAVDPGPEEEGLAMRATASVGAPQQGSLGCGAVSTHQASARAVYTFRVTEGTAVFTWNVSECVRENWPTLGSGSLVDARIVLRQGTEQLMSQMCTGSPFGTSPMTLDTGTYELTIRASFNFFNDETPTTADALSKISATATVAPT